MQRGFLPVSCIVNLLDMRTKPRPKVKREIVYKVPRKSINEDIYRKKLKEVLERHSTDLSDSELALETATHAIRIAEIAAGEDKFVNTNRRQPKKA